MVHPVLENFDELSRRADRSGIQDSVAIRNVALCRELASMLIAEKGELNLSEIDRASSLLKNNLHSLRPDRQYDTRRKLHILQVLDHLKNNKEAVRLLRSIGRPPNNNLVDKLIRATLGLSDSAPLSDIDARRASLAAWFTYLRQTVGSCFATAPAIIVHDEQPLQFLQDLNELFATGRLKRTFGGVEHAVPLSISWGAGDLKRGIIFRGSEGFNTTQLWLSPGLMAAAEGAGMIPQEVPLKQKIQRFKKQLEEFFEEPLQNNGIVATSPNKIIEGLLLRHLNLSAQEFEEFRKRKSTLPLQNVFGAASSLPQGKEKALVQFVATLERMKDAFKLLTECPLLKVWEFTLASFAETKAQFTTWNLYTSLGLQPDQPGGIGQAIFNALKDKLEQANRRVQELQLEYEQMYGQVSYLQTRMSSASTEKEVQWLKIEYQSRSHEFRMLEELRDKAHHKAQRISGLYQVIIDQLIELFPRFFQEVYDADLHAVETGPYDDSPAGFRLIYKHGRANTAQWSYIDSPEEFVEALYNFFTLVERDMASLSEFTALEHELSDCITAVTKQIRTVEFLVTAFQRMAAYHHTPMVANPLENLDKIAKKPWAYTSGGTMGSLVSNYFRVEEPPKEVSRWVENSMELMVFFIDTIKQIPPKVLEDFIKEQRSSFLTHSPTHAFLIKPFYNDFQTAWKNETFTYTYVRDQVILPMLRKVDELHLDRPQMDFLIQALREIVPPDNRFYFGRAFAQFPYEYTSTEFREYIFQQMGADPGLQKRGQPVLFEEQVDQLLYQMLPLVHRRDLWQALQEIFAAEKTLPESIKMSVLQLAEEKGSLFDGEYIPSHALLKLCKALVAEQQKVDFWETDLHAAFLDAMRKTGYALAAPFIVADSNWMRDDFGFVVSPGTGRVEFWRLDPYGSDGAPLKAWDPWLDGSHKDPKWGVYIEPKQYYSFVQSFP